MVSTYRHRSCRCAYSGNHGMMMLEKKWVLHSLIHFDYQITFKSHSAVVLTLEYNFIYIYMCVCVCIACGGATAWGGPWPPLQYASRPFDPLLCLSIHLFPSFSGPWTRHPAISFLVFLFVLLHTAFRTTSFLELRCLAFFLCDQAIVLFAI